MKLDVYNKCDLKRIKTCCINEANYRYTPSRFKIIIYQFKLLDVIKFDYGYKCSLYKILINCIYFYKSENILCQLQTCIIISQNIKYDSMRNSESVGEGFRGKVLSIKKKYISGSYVMIMLISNRQASI